MTSFKFYRPSICYVFLLWFVFSCSILTLANPQAGFLGRVELRCWKSFLPLVSALEPLDPKESPFIPLVYKITSPDKASAASYRRPVAKWNADDSTPPPTSHSLSARTILTANAPISLRYALPSLAPPVRESQNQPG